MASLRPDLAALRVVQLSHLKCGECGFEFDYQWVPAVSLTLIRLGKSRQIRCPKCENRSSFNLSEARVDPRSHRCSVKVGPI